MSKEFVTTKIAEGGLRFKFKAVGSPFGDKSGFVGAMSYMKCGRHKPRALGSFKRLLGGGHFHCDDCGTVSAVSKS